MKVTALIPDDLVAQVRSTTGGKNITESIIIALEAYLRDRKINDVMDEVERQPLVFREGFAPYGLRSLNRKQ